MTSIIAVQKQIRRAVQSRLYNAAIAANFVDPDGNPRIQWKGVPFERKDVPDYMAVEIGMGTVVVHEIGPTPMMEGPGFVTIIIRTKIDLGEDGNDALLGIIAAAYPYGSVATFEGVSVNIDKTEHRGYGEDGAWLTGLVSVDWNIYRRTTP